MTEVDLLYGFIIGMFMRTRQPVNPLTMIIGIAILAAFIIVEIFLCRDLGQLTLSDSSKAIWAMTFFVLPIISWIGYFFVVKKGRSPSR